MNYRYLGKQRALAFGVWPGTGLAEARAECDAEGKVVGARRNIPPSGSSSTEIAATGQQTRKGADALPGSLPQNVRANVMPRVRG